jgi:hypothetical protein
MDLVQVEPAAEPGASRGGVERAIAQGDRAVARIAAAQHGVVTRAQLAAAGLSRGAIGHRVA